MTPPPQGLGAIRSAARHVTYRPLFARIFSVLTIARKGYKCSYLWKTFEAQPEKKIQFTPSCVTLCVWGIVKISTVLWEKNYVGLRVDISARISRYCVFVATTAT